MDVERFLQHTCSRLYTVYTCIKIWADVKLVIISKILAKRYYARCHVSCAEPQQKQEVSQSCSSKLRSLVHSRPQVCLQLIHPNLGQSADIGTRPTSLLPYSAAVYGRHANSIRPLLPSSFIPYLRIYPFICQPSSHHPSTLHLMTLPWVQLQLRPQDPPFIRLFGSPPSTFQNTLVYTIPVVVVPLLWDGDKTKSLHISCSSAGSTAAQWIPHVGIQPQLLHISIDLHSATQLEHWQLCSSLHKYIYHQFTFSFI